MKQNHSAGTTAPFKDDPKLTELQFWVQLPGFLFIPLPTKMVALVLLALKGES